MPGGCQNLASVDLSRTLEPFSYVHFNSLCNLACFYCYEEHGTVDPARVKVEIEKQLRFGRTVGYRVVVFESGELLMLPGWQEMVSLARQLGYQQQILVTNLTLLSHERLQALVENGLTAVAGTIFAFDDDEARQVTDRPEVFKRQRAALRRLASEPRLAFFPHLMLTRRTTEQLWSRIDRLEELCQRRLDTLVFSAIEAFSQQVSTHPCYSDALDLPWPEIMARGNEQGRFFLVQNIPACLLGPWAHRSFLIRKRVGRVLAGWPDEEQAAYRVNELESLYGRVPPQGECHNCRLLSVCQRFMDYRRKQPTGQYDDTDVIDAILHEEGIDADARAIAAVLQKVESSSTARTLYQGAYS